MLLGFLFKKTLFRIGSYAAIIGAFIFILVAAQRQGMKMERLAIQARAREVLLGDLKLKERIRNEILGDAAVSAINRLRASKWNRGR